MSLPPPANYVAAALLLAFAATCGYEAYMAYAHGIVIYKS